MPANFGNLPCKAGNLVSVANYGLPVANYNVTGSTGLALALANQTPLAPDQFGAKSDFKLTDLPIPDLPPWFYRLPLL